MKLHLMNRFGEYSFLFVVGMVLFTGLNAAVFCGWTLYSANNANPLAQPPVRANLSDLDDDGLDLLLKETWEPGWHFEPWVAFAENPRNGRYVTVHEDGFRRTVGSSNNLNSKKEKIFFLGGSTTFGYNVADEHTIASYFQELSPSYDVLNFGRAYYFSKQENMLLFDLIEQGLRPKIAIFVDGLNERCDGYRYEDTLAQMFYLAQNIRGEKSLDWLYTALSQIPAMRAVDTLLQKFGGITPDVDRFDCGEMKLEELVMLRLRNRRSICDTFGIECVTLLQPFAGVHGKHVDFESLGQIQRGILRQKWTRLKSIQSADWIDISYSLDTIERHAYVDNVHYSPEANERIATAILTIVSDDLSN